MTNAYICDAVRTPIGRYGGALSGIRADDLAAIPLKALQERHPKLDWSAVDDVILGCANQAGEDNRNIARMALLLAGLPLTIGGVTLNRLCGSGLDAVGSAARAIKAGECNFMLAGGVESMSRAPYVMGKSESSFGRTQALYDTTIGWRFINPFMDKAFGTHSMPQTADEVARHYGISRQDQDLFAYRSQSRWAKAQSEGVFTDEIIKVILPAKGKGSGVVITEDEHPRPDTTVESLSQLKPLNGANETVSAGNASGVNDGAAGLMLLSEAAAHQHGLTPLARVVAMAVAGVEPRLMGIGPVPAIRKLLAMTKLSLGEIGIIEINEAFAAQALACVRELGLADDAPHVNRYGGAIALGHPLGMSGARLATTACYELQRSRQRYALCAMCIGVGQGIALLLERA